MQCLVSNFKFFITRVYLDDIYNFAHMAEWLEHEQPDMNLTIHD